MESKSANRQPFLTINRKYNPW